MVLIDDDRTQQNHPHKYLRNDALDVCVDVQVDTNSINALQFALEAFELRPRPQCAHGFQSGHFA